MRLSMTACCMGAFWCQCIRQLCTRGRTIAARLLPSLCCHLMLACSVACQRASMSDHYRMRSCSCDLCTKHTQPSTLQVMSGCWVLTRCYTNCMACLQRSWNQTQQAWHSCSTMGCWRWSWRMPHCSSHMARSLQDLGWNMEQGHASVHAVDRAFGQQTLLRYSIHDHVLNAFKCGCCWTRCIFSTICMMQFVQSYSAWLSGAAHLFVQLVAADG